LTYRLPFPPPARADGTALPAAVAAVLAAMLLLQLAIPREVSLPEPGVVRPFALDPARPTPLSPGVARPLVAVAAPGAAAPVAQGSVEGARAIGIVARGGRRIGFLQTTDGAVVSLAPGESYRGWRLVAAGAGALVFRRGGETATLRLSAAPSAPRAPTP
jgi:hypothetical protein